jgi:hypothetical protein
VACASQTLAAEYKITTTININIFNTADYLCSSNNDDANRYITILIMLQYNHATIQSCYITIMLHYNRSDREFARVLQVSL